MKNALVPVSYADKLGLATGVGEKGNRTPHDTGRPVKKVDKLWVAKLLKKNQHFANLPVSRNGENKLGGKAKSIARFLVDAYKLSDEQGYLTIDDLKTIAGLSSVNFGSGIKELSTIIAKMCNDDCITVAGRGRTAGEMNDETDFAVDDVTLDVDNIDDLDLADFC